MEDVIKQQQSTVPQNVQIPVPQVQQANQIHLTIDELFTHTESKKASDLHIIPGYQPSIRVNGALTTLRTLPVITGKLSYEMFLSILSDQLKEQLITNKEVDFGYNHGEHRYRVNLYYVKGEVAGAFRLISTTIPSALDLGLPEILMNLPNSRQGFVLVTGPTGEGKSTTIASLVNQINMKESRHILTIEDPIEYVYPMGRSLVSQRELSQDTHSWSVALKSALREDPDVVVVGEMRDYETIQSALTIAETGHLVFSTLHTNSVPQTIDRIVDVFPPNQQNQVRIQLAASLKAIVSQRLLPTIDGNGRIPACEILFNNNAVASTIRDGKTHLIDNIMETSSEEGMVLMEKALSQLYFEGKISKDTAMQYAIRQSQIAKIIQ